MTDIASALKYIENKMFLNIVFTKLLAVYFNISIAV